MSSPRAGYRGYIASRPVRETSFPQRIQNAVVRSYAERHGFDFNLSLTEYAMPGCYMVLQSLLDEVPRLQGVIVFSMFMLPPQRERRRRIYERFLANGCALHAALEDTAVQAASDLPRFEDTLDVANALAAAPLHGRFRKDGAPFPPSDQFSAALRRALGLS